MRIGGVRKALYGVLCLFIFCRPVKLWQAGATSDDLPLQAGRRQLLQWRTKASWLSGKAGSAADLTGVNNLSQLTPAEKSERLKEGRRMDLAALMELKQSFHPDSQKFLGSWLEGGEPCTFPKITCDTRTGRISEIDLAVTENLAALYPELRAVIAAFEQNPIAQSIATNKRTVQAAEMQLTTQKAPWEDPTMPHSLTAWPAGMYPYSAITMKALPSGPAFLKLNQTLRALHISNAVLLKQTLPAEWGSFVSLRELTLTGLDLRGTLPGEWAGMINMTQLILADNPNLHGSLPAAWSTMKQMKLLDVSLNYASGLRSGISGTLPQSWSSMAKLETLNLWRTSVVGHLPPSWADMKRLQVLALSDTGISGSLPSAWSRMPKLATVHVANTLIGGSLPSSWAKLPNLALLDLRGTAVMEPVPSSWKALCKRNGTKVWDSVAAAYSWPPSLQYGQVAHVYLPWVGPDGNLWEINHDDFSLCNACRHLMSERSMQGPLVIVVCCVLFGLVGCMFRAGVSPMYQRLKSRQI